MIKHISSPPPLLWLSAVGLTLLTACESARRTDLTALGGAEGPQAGAQAGAQAGSNTQGGAQPPLDSPWFEEHIRPIMLTYCTACHGATAAGGAPSTFRLDECEPEGTSGAKVMASRLHARAVLGDPTFMPPGAQSALSAEEQRLTSRWLELGAPCLERDLQTPPPPRHHPEGYADAAAHGRDLKLQTEDCRDCHGADLSGGESLSCDTCHTPTWRTDCVFCHGGDQEATGAPPRGLDPSRDPFSAHTPHTEGTLHAPFDCDECHTKPTQILSLNHIFDSTPGAAEVSFEAGLSRGGRYDGGASCSNLYCHGDGQRPGAWSEARGEVGCASCHPGQGSGRGAWGEMSGAHEDHLREGISCADCHASVTNAAGVILDPALHVNGAPDVSPRPGVTYGGGSCSGTCHGEYHSARRWR